MIVVLVVSVGLASLLHASEAWAGLMLLVVCFFLGIAVLGVAYRRGGRRAAWAGFALFCGGYLAMAWWGNWDNKPEDNPKRPAPQSRMLTTQVLDILLPSIGPSAHDRARFSTLERLFGRVDARDVRISALLDKPVSMPFTTETPLEDVIKYIKIDTTGPGLPSGLPIYVDPVGLNAAEVSMASPITLDLEGVALGTALELILKQLDLTYLVNNGMLTITYVQAEEPDEAFRQVGHTLFALLAGCLGAVAGWGFHATRPKKTEPNPQAGRSG